MGLSYTIYQIRYKNPIYLSNKWGCLIQGLDFIKFIIFNYLTLFALPKTFSFLALYIAIKASLAGFKYSLGSNLLGFSFMNFLIAAVIQSLPSLSTLILQRKVEMRLQNNHYFGNEDSLIFFELKWLEELDRCYRSYIAQPLYL